MIPEGFVDMDGARLEARWIGPPPADAATLVFLHEGLGSVSLWRDFPDRLAAATGCGALVYSRLGYGRSDPVTLPRPLDFLTTDGVRGLPRLLEATGIERAILIGHSDGASIAVVHAGSGGGARLLGAVLAAPHVFCEPMNIERIRAVREEWRTTDLRRRLRRHHGDNVDCAFLGWCEAWLDPGFAHHIDLRHHLPRIAVPLMVIQGEQDAYGTALQYQTIAAQVVVPCEVVVLDPCGHSPHRDQPDATLAAMTRFVRGLV